jgi:cysteine desulfurase
MKYIKARILMKQIYLDNNATTKIATPVVEEMLPFLKENYGNPSSLHSFGKTAGKALNLARQKVADLINADPEEIYFTSGGTEADNLAIKGVAYKLKHKGNHIITSKTEHPAVLEACKFLEKNGFKVSYIGTDTNGVFDLEELKKEITDKTILISVMFANNEVGTIQPIYEISKIAQSKNILFHSDAVQAVGKMEIDVKYLGLNLLAISAHKINGPNGVGALFIKKGTTLEPLLHGGHQEKKKRPGTQNLPGIVGFGKACELALEFVINKNRIKELEETRNYLEELVEKEIENITINGKEGPRTPNTSNISFHFTEGEAILLSLDLKGVAVSTGSACASGSLEPSYVLSSMKVPIEHAQGAIRFSLSSETTKIDIETTVSILKEVVGRIRDLSPLYEDMLESKEK